MYRSYLAHYGVKGMKWGVRRQRKKSAARRDREAWRSMSRSDRKENQDKYNKRYTVQDRSMDRVVYGNRGIRRINRRMNKGQTHAQAERRELVGNAMKGLALATAISAAADLYSLGPEGRRALGQVLNNYAKMGVQSFINSAKAKNAARQAREQIPRLVANVSQNRTIKLKPWQYKVSR